MSLFKKLFNNNTEDKLPDITTEPGMIYAPLSGKVISLSQIGDGVFSEGILGNGCGIIPSEETVYAPFDGKVIQSTDTKHAIGLESNDGIELLIHVGMDTVAMNGKGFQVFVSEGDIVTCGQKLMTFSKKNIADAGYPDTTAIVITNSDTFNKMTFEASDNVTHQDKIISVSK